jgi:hypothetical protein
MMAYARSRRLHPAIGGAGLEGRKSIGIFHG